MTRRGAGAQRSAGEQGRVVRAGAVMAAGTLVSRVTGFVRASVIAATLGLALTADVFNVPNTIPNSLYVLVAGGVLNAVLVPQLIRAIKDDADGGEAYAQRLATVVLAVLLVATVLAVALAPWVVSAYVDPSFRTPALAPQYDAMVMLARLCLPQIFFYGAYVLLGQILNARGSFGPMMWTPIVNNLVAIAVFGGYLLVYGPLNQYAGRYTDAQIWWFGAGSTLGIVAQALLLLPVLRRTGLRLRLRRDVRGVGLGKAARLGLWTILFVVVNQITYLVVVRLATGASASNPDQAAGLSVYSGAFLIVMVPHAIITVSLATALLPSMSRQAADGDLTTMGRELAATIRTCLAVIVPAAVLIAAVSLRMAELVFGYGAAGTDFPQVALALVMFAPGLVAFTVHYLVLRGFYALEDTRTPVLVQACVIAVVNIAVAVMVVRVLPVRYPAAGLAGAYSAAYVLGALASYAVLSRRLAARGGRRLGARALLGYLARVLVAALPAGLVAWGLQTWLDALLGPGRWTNMLVLAVSGTLGLLVYLVLARLMGLREIARVVSLLSGRTSGRRPSMDGPEHRGGPSGGEA